MTEIHNNNRVKANEMATYESRIENIGRECSITAKKMSSTATKVDKLHSAMKNFIRVMADAVGANNSSNVDLSTEKQQHLRQIADLLDDDDEEADDDGSDSPLEMDVDKTNTISPSPGAEEALGGEGSQK